MLANDFVYRFENLGDSGSGGAPDKMFIPVGLATGSQTNLVMTTDEMARAVGNEMRREIQIHEERPWDCFLSQITGNGLRIAGINLADGVPSLLR